MAVPVEFKPGGDRTLEVVWDDGETTRYSFRALRRDCPCATCREMRSKTLAQPSAVGGIIPLRMVDDNAPSADPQLVQVDWIGNYAVKLTWDDGHATGIYPYPLLRQLALKDDLRDE